MEHKAGKAKPSVSIVLIRSRRAYPFDKTDIFPPRIFKYKTESNQRIITDVTVPFFLAKSNVLAL
jgi:hypothetical protein